MKIKLTLDSFAVLLYCSDLIPTQYEQLTNEEWYDVVQALSQTSIKTVSRLFGMNYDVLTKIIGVDEMVAKKIIDRNELMGSLFHCLHNLENEQIQVTTIYEDNYPEILKDLHHRAPLVLYYVGDLDLMNDQGISIVGPQKYNKRFYDYTRQAVTKIHDEGRPLIASGIKGVDEHASKLMIEYGGPVIFFVSDHMFDKIRIYEKQIKDHQVLILSAVDPYAYFNVTNALDRNIYVCGLSSAQFVIASRINSGATWFTAIQNFHYHWTKQLVMQIRAAHNGNLRLIEMGGIPIKEDDLLSLLTIEEIIEKNRPADEVSDLAVDQMSIFEFIEDNV